MSQYYETCDDCGKQFEPEEYSFTSGGVFCNACLDDRGELPWSDEEGGE
ncbi:MAG: hypothetical protein VB042_05245 [Victivallaceae bacterium]|nr:hypothetical protein [Victivallaceae bacterium]